MHIEAVPNRKSHPTILLRESYRAGDKVKKRTIANLRIGRGHWSRCCARCCAAAWRWRKPPAADHQSLAGAVEFTAVLGNAEHRHATVFNERRGERPVGATSTSLHYRQTSLHPPPICNVRALTQRLRRPTSQAAAWRFRVRAIYKTSLPCAQQADQPACRAVIWSSARYALRRQLLLSRTALPQTGPAR